MFTVYTRSGCGYCIAAKNLLGDKGLLCNEIDITNKPTMNSEIMRRSGMTTVPIIYYYDGLIGGFTELKHWFSNDKRKEH